MGGCTFRIGPVSVPVSDNPITLVTALENGVNEVYMVDTDAWYAWGVPINGFDPASPIDSFPIFYCVYLGETACVISTRYTDTSDFLPSLPFGNPFVDSIRTLDEGSVDVLVHSSRNDVSLALPSRVEFNTCLNSSGDRNNNKNLDAGYDNYRLMVHEAGHAVGLSGFFITSFWSYEGAHPTIPDSAMGYDKYTPPWAEALLNPDPEDPRGLYREPDCSPHPWDIMAVEALYQNAD